MTGGAMRGIITFVSLLVVTIALTAPAASQSPREHRGFWISAGVGGGWNLTRNVGIDSASEGGAGGYLRLGGTITPRLLIGGEVAGWGRSIDGVDVARGNVTVTALFYPSVQTGVYLKGGLGGSSLANTVTEGNTTVTVHDEGFGATLGVGWDVRLARNFYITPGIDFLYQRASSVDNTILLMTVGVTWH